MTNIALVVLDTLRKDRFDRYFDWLPGVRFDRAYSTANWTVPAHATLFTGLYPSEVGVHSKYTLFDYPGSSLAEELSKGGYRTRAFSANTNITGHFDFDRGFDEFFSPREMRHLNNPSIVDWREFGKNTEKKGISKILSGLKLCFSEGKDTVESIKSGFRFKFGGGGTKPGVDYGGAIEAIDKIDQLEFGQNEFLFVNLMETHEPYQAPEKYKTVPEPDLLKTVGDLRYGVKTNDNVTEAYDNCAKYLSDVYQILFNLLTEDFDYVITISDHGEMLGEDGMWGHEYGLHSMLTHIPLVISGPNVNDRAKKEPVSLIDIYNTVTDMAEISDQSSRGRSLLREIGNDDFLTEYHGLTSWSLNNLEENGYSDQIETYDEKEFGILVDGEYFFETNKGMTNREKKAEQEVKTRLVELVSDLDERKVESANEIPDEVQSHLEDLGYA